MFDILLYRGYEQTTSIIYLFFTLMQMTNIFAKRFLILLGVFFTFIFIINTHWFELMEFDHSNNFIPTELPQTWVELEPVIELSSIQSLQNQWFYWKNNRLCLWSDISKESSTESCYQSFTYNSNDIICTERLIKIDHSEEIMRLQEQIKKLESDYKKEQRCDKITITQEKLVLSIDTYTYKIIKWIKTVIQVVYWLPVTWAR